VGCRGLKLETQVGSLVPKSEGELELWAMVGCVDMTDGVVVLLVWLYWVTKVPEQVEQALAVAFWEYVFSSNSIDPSSLTFKEWSVNSS
jgi:hypothetical protein